MYTYTHTHTYAISIKKTWLGIQIFAHGSTPCVCAEGGGLEVQSSNIFTFLKNTSHAKKTQIS